MLVSPLRQHPKNVPETVNKKCDYFLVLAFLEGDGTTELGDVGRPAVGWNLGLDDVGMVGMEPNELFTEDFNL